MQSFLTMNSRFKLELLQGYALIFEGLKKYPKLFVSTDFGGVYV